MLRPVLGPYFYLGFVHFIYNLLVELEIYHFPNVFLFMMTGFFFLKAFEPSQSYFYIIWSH